MMQGGAAEAEESMGKHRPFPETVGENSEFSVVTETTVAHAVKTMTYTGVCTYVYGVYRSPQYVQKSTVCAGGQSVCRGP